MKLVDAMYDVFKESKLWFRVSIISSVLLVCISVVGLFDYFKEHIVVLALASFLIQLFSFFSRVMAEKKLDLAEYIRRSFMLSEGLGTPLTQKDVKRIMRKTGKTSFAISPASNNYYESQTPSGPVRLAENIREASFFTSYISESASYLFFSVSLIAFVGFLISLFVASTTLNDLKTIRTLATAILALVGFIASSDFLSLALKFRSLHYSSEEVYNCIEELLKNNPNPSESEVLLLLGDYNCATVTSPPIPELIYKWKRDFLNELWNKARNP